MCLCTAGNDPHIIAPMRFGPTVDHNKVLSALNLGFLPLLSKIGELHLGSVPVRPLGDLALPFAFSLASFARATPQGTDFLLVDLQPFQYILLFGAVVEIP